MTASEIFRSGLWRDNVVFSQLLALCPAMAVTTTGTNGLGMGLATMAVLVVANSVVAALRHLVSPQVRIPVFIVVIATLVTLVDMAMNAWLHELYKVLGLFIALIVVNCAILGRAEAFASKSPVAAAALDGVAMGLGLTFALVLIGLIRELVGSGTLFAQASLLLGPNFAFLEMRVLPDYGGVLVMVLPPAGFLVLGLLLAAKRAWESREQAVAAAAVAAAH